MYTINFTDFVNTSIYISDSTVCPQCSWPNLFVTIGCYKCNVCNGLGVVSTRWYAWYCTKRAKVANATVVLRLLVEQLEKELLHILNSYQIVDALVNNYLEHWLVDNPEPVFYTLESKITEK